MYKYVRNWDSQGRGFAVGDHKQFDVLWGLCLLSDAYCRQKEKETGGLQHVAWVACH